MTEHTNAPEVELDENQLIAERYKKLGVLRSTHDVAFPNDFRRTHLAAELIQSHGEMERTRSPSKPSRCLCVAGLCCVGLWVKPVF